MGEQMGEQMGGARGCGAVSGWAETHLNGPVRRA